MEPQISWLRRMAVRLQSLIHHSQCPVSLDDALDLMGILIGRQRWADVAVFSLDDALTINAASFGYLADAIQERFHLTLSAADLIALLLTPGDPVRGKIRKKAPFAIARLTDEYPWYAHLLNDAIKQIRELPDFSDDKKIMVMTDFSGEHADAPNHTYSFVFFAQDKIPPFERAVSALRTKHRYNEIAYKRLDSGPTRRALPEFLDLIDRHIHGVVLTIAIDKDIPTVFGVDKRAAHEAIIQQLEGAGLGTWTGKGPLAEKVVRICHTLAIFSSLLLSDDQLLLWYCDNDPINADGNQRNFQHVQEIYKASWQLFATQRLELLGFAKSFDEKTYLDDMLSVADLAAGAVQDLLQLEERGGSIPGGEEKLRVIKWLVTNSPFLSKIHIQITKMENGDVGTGLVTMTPTDELLNYNWTIGNADRGCV